MYMVQYILRTSGVHTFERYLCKLSASIYKTADRACMSYYIRSTFLKWNQSNEG